MIRQGEAVFVDSGAWIALALSRDPLHSRAREQWDDLRAVGAKLHTSVPVVIETFTFLDRSAKRDVALAWKEAITKLATLKYSSASCAICRHRGIISGAAICTSYPRSMPPVSQS